VGTATGIRDRAMLEVLYSTGMRRMELMQLQVFDLDAERGTVLIRLGKGKKDRMVPIGERAIAWVESIRQLKAIHSATHPARLPGAGARQTPEHAPTPQHAPLNAAAALLMALDAEAEDEAGAEQDSVAADAWRRR